MILITGATGNIGLPTALALAGAGLAKQVIAATTRPAQLPQALRKASIAARLLNFTDDTTWPAALAGVQALFLLRPPALANVKKHIFPFLDAAALAGVRHVVFLSIQGADVNAITPHHKIERYILAMPGITYTFLWPSFFMENLTGEHRAEIKSGELYIPAGKAVLTSLVGKTWPP